MLSEHDVERAGAPSRCDDAFFISPQRFEDRGLRLCSARIAKSSEELMTSSFSGQTLAGLAAKMGAMAPAPVRFGWGWFGAGAGYLALDADKFRLSGQVGRKAVEVAVPRAAARKSPSLNSSVTLPSRFEMTSRPARTTVAK